jgi:tetratricopeptide (TPR) repeat protein
MRTTMRMAAALTAFLAAGFLYAGAQCRLVGVVTDSAGAPVDGVSVIVTTPKISTFKLTFRTDSKGKYGMVLADCTMPYHVAFEKAGFVPSSEDRKIPIGDLGTIDMRLLKTSETWDAGRAAAASAASAPSESDQAIMAFNSGVEAVNAGDKVQAQAKFLEAVTKNPDLSAGWLALTQIAFENKEWSRTVEYGQKAIDLDPSLTSLYPMLADASKAAGDKAGAAEWAAKYAEVNPDSYKILYNKGIQAYNKGKMKEAEESLVKAVAAKPDFANAQFYLGMAAFNLNHKASAKEHLQTYLELEPNGKEASTVKEILPLLK